ncbi:MAG: YgjV family protein [Oscillospiraceae bacterium]|nr:YgjV family protein [Oscillospiraceae bacterium]
MTAKYLLIQGIGLLGTALFFASFQCKSNKRLFQIQFLSYLLYTVHLLLLGAVTGGASYIINMLRSACLGSRRPFAHRKEMCLLLCLLQLGALAFTWAGWISLLPVAANIAATIGGYTHNGRKIRLVGMLINSPLWIVYDVIVGSWAGILDEAVSETSMLISILRFGWKNLDGTGETEREQKEETA